MANLFAIHERLIQQSKRLKQAASAPDGELTRVVERVSRWPITLQLEHIGIVNVRTIKNAIPGALKNLPENRTGRVSPMAYVVLWFGWIPRGRRKAPEFVQPKNAPLAEVRASVDHYAKLLESIAPQLSQIESCPGCFKHPILGPFTAAQWLRFVEVHTHHHLKIIDDIRRA